MKRTNLILIAVMLFVILMEGCAPAKKEFTVEPIKLSSKCMSDGFYFTINSNLPDGTDFLVSLYTDKDDLLGQVKEKIKAHTFTVGPFRKGEKLYPAGNYHVTVVVPVISTQAESVQKILGKKGELLKGSGVNKFSSLGFYVEQKFSVQIDEEKVVTKTDPSSVLTLPNFIKSYTENAKAINAKYDFDWTVSTGEKLDSIKIHVNEYCAMSLDINKTEHKEIKGMTIVIGDTDEKSAVEILTILYALVQTFNPEGDYGSVPAFVSDFVNQESEYKIKKGKVEYSLTKFSGNTIIFIKCE